MALRKPLFGLIATALTGLAAALALWAGSAPGNPASAAVVLQYHHVSDDTPAATSVTPERFRKHMDFLAEQDMTVVPLEQIVAARRSGEPLPERAVAITFDDAYESVYNSAFPLLEKRDWPFTVFVNTDPLDEDKAGFVSWAQLREMAEAGASIANHSTKHNHLQRRRDGESEADWRQRIKAEVLDAERRIEEETGQNHKILAYPYGEYNEALKALLKEWGFVAFGQHSGPVGPYSDLRALPRFPFGGPYGDMDDFATKVLTRPMPVAEMGLYAGPELEQSLSEVVVRAGERPVLSLTLSEDNLAGRVNCFASGQGAIETRRDGRQVMVRADKPLSPGRTRYNCTASSGESGRFYWLSQQWLVTGEDGRWVHED